MARSFNGTSALIAVNNALHYNFNKNYSIALWMNASSVPSANSRSVFSEGNSGSTASYFVMENATSGTLSRMFFHARATVTGGDLISRTTTATPFDTNWHHVCFAQNSSGHWALYIDGVQDGGTTYTTTSVSFNQQAIGCDHLQTGFSKFFSGSIAEVAKWSRQLSAGEAAALAGGLLPAQLAPDNYWPLWGTDSPEPDIGNATHVNGTLTGTSLSVGPPVGLQQIWIPGRRSGTGTTDILPPFISSNTVVHAPSVYATGVTNTFNASESWLCPAGITQIFVSAVGGGGGGNGDIASNSPHPGGGGGAYANRNAVPVTPGTVYSVTVGASGIGGATPSNGGDSSFTGDSSVQVLAKGGIGPTTSTGGSGGSAASSVGDVVFGGGKGGDGGTGGGLGGAGGGASGNILAAGNPGTDYNGTAFGSAGGAGANGGGSGGNGGDYSSNNAQAGFVPGGGGGGSGGLAGNGANGAHGQVLIHSSIAPAFSGSSSFTPGLNAFRSVAPTLAGTSSITFSALDRFSATFAGLSSLSVNLHRQQFPATFNGVGVLTFAYDLGPPGGRLSQVTAEVVRGGSPEARLSQVTVEVVRPRTGLHVWTHF